MPGDVVPWVKDQYVVKDAQELGENIASNPALFLSKCAYGSHQIYIKNAKDQVVFNRLFDVLVPISDRGYPLSGLESRHAQFIILITRKKKNTFVFQAF